MFGSSKVLLSDSEDCKYERHTIILFLRFLGSPIQTIRRSQLKYIKYKEYSTTFITESVKLEKSGNKALYER
jgi:hypothetical protein